MPGTRQRGRRLALATATAVVAATALAGSATAAPPAFYSGVSAASGLSLTLNLPAEFPGLGQTITLDLISAAGTLTHNETPGQEAPDEAASSAGLAAGSLVDSAGPLGALNQTVASSLEQPEASSSAGSVPENPLGLTLSGGNLTATSVAGTLATSSTGELANASLGSLADVLPADLLGPITAGLTTLTAGLTPLLTDVNTAIALITAPLTGASPSPAPSSSASPNPLDPITGGVGGAVGQVAGPVASAAAPILGPVGDATPQQIRDALIALQAQIQALIDAVPALVAALTDGSLVSLTGLEVEQTIGQVGDGITATARTRLAGIRLLGGFITVDGFENSATASVTGQPGAATANPVPGVAQVNVGDGTLALGLGEDGLVLPSDTPLAGLGPIVAPVNAALLTVIEQLNAILTMAGLSVVQSAASQTVAEDGRTASARASGLLVSYTIPSTEAPLIELAVGDAQVAVAAQDALAVEGETVTNPGVSTPTGTLANTGADLPTLAVLALLLATAGGLLLRRRATED